MENKIDVTKIDAVKETKELIENLTKGLKSIP